MSSEKISQLLGKVLGDIRKKQGLDKEVLSSICSIKERDAINTIKTYKNKIYIYVKANSVMYTLSLKKDKILKCLQNNSDEYITDVIFKIGEFNGS